MPSETNRYNVGSVPELCQFLIAKACIGWKVSIGGKQVAGSSCSGVVGSYCFHNKNLV